MNKNLIIGIVVVVLSIIIVSIVGVVLLLENDPLTQLDKIIDTQDCNGLVKWEIEHSFKDIDISQQQYKDTISLAFKCIGFK